MAATTTSTLSVKLLIDRKAQRVLFAEASKDVVDFLFSLLALPVATAVKLVGKDAMVGCVGNLYASVEKLDSAYVQPGAAKDALLCPTVLSPAGSANRSLLRLAAAPPPSGQARQHPKGYFRCTNFFDFVCNGYVADASGAICPRCRRQMTSPLQCVATPSSGNAAAGGGGGGNGFVQGMVTYTVMDDLTVAPMSAISSITLLNTFAVRDLADLQEKTVQLGYKEGLAIVKASLQSKSVLTDVFLGNNKSPARGRAAFWSSMSSGSASAK